MDRGPEQLWPGCNDSCGSGSDYDRQYDHDSVAHAQITAHAWVRVCGYCGTCYRADCDTDRSTGAPERRVGTSLFVPADPQHGGNPVARGSPWPPRSGWRGRRQRPSLPISLLLGKDPSHHPSPSAPPRWSAPPGPRLGCGPREAGQAAPPCHCCPSP